MPKAQDPKPEETRKTGETAPGSTTPKTDLTAALDQQLDALLAEGKAKVSKLDELLGEAGKLVTAAKVRDEETNALLKTLASLREELQRELAGIQKVGKTARLAKPAADAEHPGRIVANALRRVATVCGHSPESVFGDMLQPLEA